MFWGVTLDGGKRYTQTVESPFHLSMAALDQNMDGGDSRSLHVQVMVQHDTSDFLLCTLNHTTFLQQPLDLNFNRGEEVTFFLNGAGIVHLTGYLLEDDDFVDEINDEDSPAFLDSDEEEEAPQLKAADDSESCDNEDWSPAQTGVKMKRKASNMGGKAHKKRKLKELEADDNKHHSISASSEVQNGESGHTEKKKKKRKKKKKAHVEEQTGREQVEVAQDAALADVPRRRIVAGGTVVEDAKIGHGPVAKPGKMVSVYYVGTLAKNNKRFDSCVSGKPFRFHLGHGEVIKGWDTGLIGMKVGGKRRITVPPSQGYGNNRQGPIPAGSTLVFDVELRAIS